MISIIISGNLGKTPEMKESKWGANYKISLGSTVMSYDPEQKKSVPKTIWASGTIGAKKIESILPFLTPGRYVVVNAPNAKPWIGKDKAGAPVANLDLGFLASVEAGISPAERDAHRAQREAAGAGFPTAQPQPQAYQQTVPQHASMAVAQPANIANPPNYEGHPHPADTNAQPPQQETEIDFGTLPF